MIQPLMFEEKCYIRFDRGTITRIIVYFCFVLFGVPVSKVINVSVQYNGGLLPDITLLPSGNPFKCHEEVFVFAYDPT